MYVLAGAVSFSPDPSALRSTLTPRVSVFPSSRAASIYTVSPRFKHVLEILSVDVSELIMSILNKSPCLR